MSTEMIWVVRSTGSDDTETLGEVFGRLLRPPLTIELISDLGGGKTTFVRGLARGLGSDDTVSSPTFTLSKLYKAKEAQINHYDLYRLSQPGIMKDEVRESLENPNAITIIEWSGELKESLPDARFSIKFLPVATNQDERDIEITYPLALEDIIKRLQIDWKEVRP